MHTIQSLLHKISHCPHTLSLGVAELMRHNHIIIILANLASGVKKKCKISLGGLLADLSHLLLLLIVCKFVVLKVFRL